MARIDTIAMRWTSASKKRPDLTKLAPATLSSGQLVVAIYAHARRMSSSTERARPDVSTTLGTGYDPSTQRDGRLLASKSVATGETFAA